MIEFLKVIRGVIVTAVLYVVALTLILGMVVGAFQLIKVFA